VLTNTLGGYYGESMRNVKKRALHRAKIIAGQVNKIVDMLNSNRYCVDIMTQSLAAQKALNSLNELILHDHLQTCVVDQIKRGEDEKSIEELKNLYHLSNK